MSRGKGPIHGPLETIAAAAPRARGPIRPQGRVALLRPVTPERWASELRLLLRVEPGHVHPSYARDTPPGMGPPTPYSPFHAPISRSWPGSPGECSSALLRGR